MRPVEDDWPEFWEQVNHAVLRAGSSLDTYRSDEHPHVVRVFSLDWGVLEPLIDDPEQPNNHRLDFGGNRRINSVLYMASITQARDHPDARRYLDRKATDGKPKRSARRAHKRHLANRVIRRMWRDEQARTDSLATAA